MPERKTGKRAARGGAAELKPTSRGRRMLAFTAKVIAPVLVLAAAGVSFVGLKATKPDVPQKPVSEKVWPVTAKTAKVADFQPDIRLFGNAISGRRVELRALVAGEITDIGDRFRDGGIVRKDELLLRVDKFEYEGALVEAEANLAEARARYAEIEATIENEQDALKRTKS